jgi:hypothetical protein
MEVCMSDVEAIKKIAEEYEMPVEQVALIWSVISYMDENYDIYFDGDISPVVRDFIKNKLN